VPEPPVLVIENGPADPVGPLGEWLTAAGLRLVTCRPSAGDPLPPDLSDLAGLVVLGGAMGAVDDSVAPWLPGVRALLAAAVRDEVPALGICLGHQLLAVAAGGRVGTNPQGPEYGAQLVAKRAAAATDPLFRSLPITPDVIQWHHDAVLDLPPGAVLLATSPGCDVQALRVGRLAWGIQFHVETTPAIVRRWAADDEGALAGYDVPTLVARAEAVHADLADVWAPFAAGFATVVRDPAAVPAPRAVRTTTAEPITDPAQIRAALAAQMQSAHGTGHPATLPWPGSAPRDTP
jgi:GMP synthase (glutamine-hydrolysing)